MYRIELFKGDITQVKVNAIVDAAKIVIKETEKFFRKIEGISWVILVCLDEKTYYIYKSILYGVLILPQEKNGYASNSNKGTNNSPPTKFVFIDIFYKWEHNDRHS
jgi:hypothetical protein